VFLLEVSGLNAVEVVCAGQDLDISRVSLLLANLVDKSMVQLVDEDLPVIDCWRLCGEYGRDHIDEEERATVRARHAAWYLKVAEQLRSIVGGSG